MKKFVISAICVLLSGMLFFGGLYIAALCVRGTVVQIRYEETRGVIEDSILIEIQKPSILFWEPSLDKVWLYVDDVSQYAVGDRVFAWLGFSGGVADSYPPQTSANQVWVLRKATD